MIVPVPLDASCSPRVLCMSFEKGLSIGRLHEIYSLHRQAEARAPLLHAALPGSILHSDYFHGVQYSAPDVAALISRTFAELM